MRIGLVNIDGCAGDELVGACAKFGNERIEKIIAELIPCELYVFVQIFKRRLEGGLDVLFSRVLDP